MSNKLKMRPVSEAPKDGRSIFVFGNSVENENKVERANFVGGKWITTDTFTKRFMVKDSLNDYEYFSEIEDFFYFIDMEILSQEPIS